MRLRLLHGPLCGSLLICLACSSTSSPSAPASPTTSPEIADSGSAAAEGGDLDAATDPPECTRAGDAGNVARDTSKLTFSSSTDVLSPERDHHSTFIVETTDGPYLYVLGGAKDDFASVDQDIVRAKIKDDGSLDTLAPYAQLPLPRAGHAFGQTATTIYLLGGLIQQGVKVGFTKTTTFAAVNADGSFGAWKSGPDLPVAVMHAATVIVGEWLYVFGGTTGAAAVDMSVRAKIQPDGSLGAFDKVTPLSPHRSHQSTFEHNGSIYLVGGLVDSPQGNPTSVGAADIASFTCTSTGVPASI